MGLSSGSEPRIISTMASKSAIQTPYQGTIIGNPDAEEIYRDLLNQHKARKLDDPVNMFTINNKSSKSNALCHCTNVSEYVVFLS